MWSRPYRDCGGRIDRGEIRGTPGQEGAGDQVLVALKNGTSVIAPTKLVVHKVIKNWLFFRFTIISGGCTTHLSSLATSQAKRETVNLTTD